MSRSQLKAALILLAASMLAACDDRTMSGPRQARAPGVSFERGSAEGGDVTVVTATGDASADVGHVQDAVNNGGRVVLKGHFSFDTPPRVNNTIAPALVPIGLPQRAEVKITNSVSISGGDGDGAEMTTIDGGTIPFYIEAAGQAVSIRRLHFVQPTSHAILVFAVGGLEIASTRVEGLKTFSPKLNGAVSILTGGAIPNPTAPGKPSNVAGNLVIADNDFDVSGGTNAENVLGITVFSVGDSAAPVEARLSGNRISNTTEPAINFRRVVGHVTIDHNVIRTGQVGVDQARGEGIRVANLGTYLIAHNVIDCEWLGVTDAQGIGVFSQFAAWPIEHATVEYNRITMSPSAGTVFNTFSAGIEVYGFANSNVVRHNTIRGEALAGISIPSVFPLPPQTAAKPTDNAFIRNRFVDFHPSDADIFVGDHAVGTLVVGRGTLDTLSTVTVKR